MLNKILGVEEGRVQIGPYSFNLISGLVKPPVSQIHASVKRNEFLFRLADKNVAVIGIRQDVVGDVVEGSFVAIADAENGGNPISIAIKFLCNPRQVINDLNRRTAAEPVTKVA
jgi:hypothetical protein